jgi:hypothetical protein
MPLYGEVITNIIGVYVAVLNSDNSFASPTLVDYVQSVSQSLETDEDTLKAYGVNLEALNVIIGGESTIEEAALNTLAKAIVMGETSAELGVDPNLYATVDTLGGGAGTPYFGLVVVFAATEGGAVARGFPKCKLKNTPDWEVEQNSFRTGELEMMHLAANQTSKKIVKQRRYQNATDVPDFGSATIWDTFLGDLFT